MNGQEIKRQMHELRSSPSSSTDCQRKLSPSVQRLVRRVTRSGRVSNRLDQFILDEANEFLQNSRADEPVDRDALVCRVSERLCQLVIDRIDVKLPRSPHRDTIRQQLLETAIAT